MPFAGLAGPVAAGFEDFDEGDLVGGKGLVQLLGAGVVRVAAGDDARSAGAA